MLISNNLNAKEPVSETVEDGPTMRNKRSLVDVMSKFFQTGFRKGATVQH